jgi:phospholipid/cholesterol/gamma-HCH transport system permease protein
MASAEYQPRGLITRLGDVSYRLVSELGDLALFAIRTLGWAVRRRPTRGTLIPSLYSVGVRSMPVVAITGLFIGMVLAVQSYREFANIGLSTRVGSIINISVVRELGPVLAATMIAGRVGSAMAAELGTMRVTEQIDALAALGVNPVHYLVVPRLFACVCLIPLLTVLADSMGTAGGALVCIKFFHIDPHHYWARTRGFVGVDDIMHGMVKSLFFGTAIGLVGCHRGFNCHPGAEGVGRAATEAFVASFVAILVLDFFLTLALNGIVASLWHAVPRKMI